MRAHPRHSGLDGTPGAVGSAVQGKTPGRECGGDSCDRAGFCFLGALRPGANTTRALNPTEWTRPSRPSRLRAARAAGQW